MVKKREGGGCLYFKENLPIKRRKFRPGNYSRSCNWLEERYIAMKNTFLHPTEISQINEEFDPFYGRPQEIFDIIKDAKPHCVILTGDLSCHSKQFWSDDIDSPKGVALDELIESNNLT